MNARGRGWNWRAHLDPRELALIEKGDRLVAQIEVLQAELNRTNRSPIIDRAVERARAAGDFI